MMFWQSSLQNIPQMVKKAFFGAPVDISELLLQAGNAINSNYVLCFSFRRLCEEKRIKVFKDLISKLEKQLKIFD